MNRQKLVDVSDEGVIGEIGAILRHSIFLHIGLCAVGKQREFAKRGALQSLCIGIEETQENVGFLPRQVDGLGNAVKLDFDAGRDLVQHQKAAADIAVRNSVHGGDP